MTFEQGDRLVRVSLGGAPLTTFHYGEQWDKPFLHPIRTPSGSEVSRGYPVDPKDGEERDHDWHRGIWWGHGDIGGHDFWRELGRDKTGRLVPVGEPVAVGGDETGTLEALFALRAASGEVIGHVSQLYAFARAGDTVRIDVELRILADAGQDLLIGDTEDGGFAMRLADAFRQDRGAVLSNSEGRRDTENIWGQAARWIDYSAEAGGSPAGATILDHPSNLRHPSRWHARGYSLCSANPFGLRDFTGDPGADGSYLLPSGQLLDLRYRIIIHEGVDGSGEIDRWFDEFAAQPPRRAP